MQPWILLVLGLALILLEFYLPGAIMGSIGTILILISLLILIYQGASPIVMFFFVIAALLGVAAVFKFALWQIPRTKKKQSIYLDSDQDGYKASTFDASTIGKSGIALSDLKPGGFILIEGKKYQALSVSGYITKGSKIVVLSGQEESLIVKHIIEDHS